MKLMKLMRLMNLRRFCGDGELEGVYNCSMKEVKKKEERQPYIKHEAVR